MILQVVDANNVTQQITVPAPGTPTDKSGTCNGASMIVLDPVPDGFVRAGWLIQNKSQLGNSMSVNDLGDDADDGPSSVQIEPGAMFPPRGYPVTQGQVTIIGVGGDNFMAREWLTPVPEDAA